MKDIMTLYEAKFTIYSVYKVIEQFDLKASIGKEITEEDIRNINAVKEDLRKICSSTWDLGKF